MKNLLLYTRWDKKWSRENELLAYIQVDNSLSLGWAPEDILIFSNVPFNYAGVQSIQIPDLTYKLDRTNKIPHILYLFQNGFIQPGGTYWYHDWDAYQDQPFEFDISTDLALTGYGYKPEYNCGSFFFKHSARDIFETWNSRIKPGTRVDEMAITQMMEEGLFKDRISTLNLTYNFGQRIVEMPEVYETVEKPIKVLHFHPYYTYVGSEWQNIDIFMHGKNRLGQPLMSDRLIEIFQEHEANSRTL